MKKLFYTCPIKAAYMAQEFGVQFTHNFHFSVENYGKPEIKSSWLKFYVPEESYPVFDPKKGDLVIFDPTETEPVYGQGTKDEPIKILYYKSKISPTNNIVHLNDHLLRQPYVMSSLLRILERNGKAFFLPEIESEE